MGFTLSWAKNSTNAKTTHEMRRTGRMLPLKVTTVVAKVKEKLSKLTKKVIKKKVIQKVKPKQGKKTKGKKK